ncbi:hypothetical protein ACIGXA_33495 [Streptomyces fildesensis]|uniref:Uncharacterized protein n=1 Tax=Streptomyces fildesensis TaxID=375757 RepID=A0ABW8CJ90_9ACTN
MQDAIDEILTAVSSLRSSYNTLRMRRRCGPSHGRECCVAYANIPKRPKEAIGIIIHPRYGLRATADFESKSEMNIRRPHSIRAPESFLDEWPTGRIAAHATLSSRRERMGVTSQDRMAQNRTQGEYDSAARPAEVRFLRLGDIEALIKLEQIKWDRGQASCGAEMAARIQAYPHLSIGAFGAAGGPALASLFMKPITMGELLAAATWSDCARVHSDVREATRSLFGISLSSVDADAVTAIFEFFWPYALKGGWSDIYLGSPMPGLRAWKRSRPDTPVDVYVQEKRHGLPRDPQLRYYHGKGFKDIVSCKPNYFPHPASLDYGAVLRGHIPLSVGTPLWRFVPLPWLRRMRRLLFRLL